MASSWRAPANAGGREPWERVAQPTTSSPSRSTAPPHKSLSSFYGWGRLLSMPSPSDSSTSPTGLYTVSPGGVVGHPARPELPRSTALSAAGMQEVDLAERMDPLAVAESAADGRQSLAELLSQLALIAAALVAIWWLLPRGTAPLPPLELPPPLQAEPVRPSRRQREAEQAALALVRQAAPVRAIQAFRAIVDGTEPATVDAWRAYLQTLVDLDERAELRMRATQFLESHPDRLEAAHFQAEAIRRDDPATRREKREGWSATLPALTAPKADPAALAEIDGCQAIIDDALVLLQQHDGDWSRASRTAWTDLLHLDRARLHHHAWRCGGGTFADPRREQALEAVRLLSTDSSADALTLRIDIYRRCLDAWPKPLGFDSRREIVNGHDWSRDDLRRALETDRATLAKLPPTGRR